jgi:hypothetical protein
MRSFESFSNQDCGKYLTQRGVKRLVHITKFERLSSVLKKGLSPNAANREEKVFSFGRMFAIA